MANHLAMAALIDPGDEVLIEHPAYELLVSAALYLGAEVQRFRAHAKRAAMRSIRRRFAARSRRRPS